MVSNDIVLIGFLLGILICVGVAMTYAHASVDSVYAGDSADYDEFLDETTPSVTNAWSFFINIIDAVFWGFGSLPLFINIPLFIVRLMLLLTIVRNIWIGGGG